MGVTGARENGFTYVGFTHTHIGNGSLSRSGMPVAHLPCPAAADMFAESIQVYTLIAIISGYFYIAILIYRHAVVCFLRDAFLLLDKPQ
jgi:hypothetical protein